MSTFLWGILFFSFPTSLAAVLARLAGWIDTQWWVILLPWEAFVIAAFGLLIYLQFTKSNPFQ